MFYLVFLTKNIRNLDFKFRSSSRLYKSLILTKKDNFVWCLFNDCFAFVDILVIYIESEFYMNLDTFGMVLEIIKCTRNIMLDSFSTWSAWSSIGYIQLYMSNYKFMCSVNLYKLTLHTFIFILPTKIVHVKCLATVKLTVVKVPTNW